VLWRFVTMLRDHFGTAPKPERMLGFLSWHLDFFSRYRPSRDGIRRAGATPPLIQTRWPLAMPGSLEALLRDPRPDTHQQ